MPFRKLGMVRLKTAQGAEVGHRCYHSHCSTEVQENVQLLVEVNFQGTERICGVVGTGASNSGSGVESIGY